MIPYCVRLLAALSVVALCAAALSTSANASVILNLVIDPATTAGGGATSTRSGLGSFQIYAIDAAGLGISSYNLTMGSVVTASNNRTPMATIQDANSDVWPAGFSALRSSSNAPQMQASHSLPGQSPYLISGMGQTAGSFAAVAAAGPNQPATVIASPISAAWGGAYNNITSGTKKWLFVGEGLWNTSIPITSPSQFISDATFTVYSDSAFHSVYTDTIFPCLTNCSAPTVIDAELSNVLAEDPGMLTYAFATAGSAPIIWDNFAFDSYTPLPGGSGVGPAVAPTFDTATAKFNWNTTGSPAGTYRWHVTASNPFGIDQGNLTVHIAAVPEPATLSLIATLTTVGVVLARLRSA